MKSLFSGLRIKIAAFMGTAIAVLLMIIGYKNKKIDKLEEKNAHHKKLEKIDKIMEEAEIKAEVKEDEAIKDFDDSNWNNNI